ncbi:MAG: hypothetical protein IPK33_02865 [Gemmatimonadetes bacterium]|nr:hypothetical protein [Gemmatimonadota bacterium]
MSIRLQFAPRRRGVRPIVAVAAYGISEKTGQKCGPLPRVARERERRGVGGRRGGAEHHHACAPGGASAGARRAPNDLGRSTTRASSARRWPLVPFTIVGEGERAARGGGAALVGAAQRVLAGLPHLGAARDPQ